MTSRLDSFIRQLIEIPTAPFREHWMIARLDQILAGIGGLEVQADPFGNRIARLRRGRAVGPQVVFVAHLDHPGFLLPAAPANGTLLTARFEGRLADPFFQGANVRLFAHPEDPGTRARVVRASASGEDNNQIDLVELELERPAGGVRLGMWDLPVYEQAEGLLRARACDDLVGAGVLLEMLQRLSEAGEDAPLDVAVIFSRAEEAGFCGVLMLIDQPELPSMLSPEALFVSVEISSEVPGVAPGEGAIIRTGDRSSTFDGAIADSLWALARKRGIGARRALMNMGTCEATVFARAGYRAGGVCIPLRNYHNQDLETGRIAPEIVVWRDVEQLADLVFALAQATGAGEQAELPVWNNFELYRRKGLQQLDPIELTQPQPALI